MLEIFKHAECAEPFHAHDLQQFAVANGELLIFWIVQIALLDDGPHFLDDLVARTFVGAHDAGQIR